MEKLLSIIIVNYNSKTVLQDCLNSLKNINVTGYEVIIIDNKSDEKVNDLELLYPEHCFIFNNSNIGFAAANNIGINKAAGEYILLLNPDTVVYPDSFQPMINYLSQNASTGIVGCKIFNKNGEIERSTHSFPNLLKEFIHANEFLKTLLNYDNFVMRLISKSLSFRSTASYWNHDSVREVDHVTGACMMVKREAIKKAGLLDGAFFLYNEEVEWALRIKKAGYNSIFLPDSHIIHLFGYSTKQKVQKQTVNNLLVERYRGMFYFFQKHYSFIQLIMLKLIVFQGFGFRLVFNYIKYWLNLSANRNNLSKENKYIKQIMNLVWLNNFDWRIQ